MPPSAQWQRNRCISSALREDLELDSLQHDWAAQLYTGADSRHAFRLLRHSEIRCSPAPSWRCPRRLRLSCSLAATSPHITQILYENKTRSPSGAGTTHMPTS